MKFPTLRTYGIIISSIVTQQKIIIFVSPYGSSAKILYTFMYQYLTKAKA